MPRVNKVAKCRKSPGQCGKCGDKIAVGQPYVFWAFMVGGRGGPKKIRCVKTECAPKPRDLTQSDFLIAIYDIQETKFDGTTPDDLESQRDECVNDLQSLLDETQGKLENMPEGLQQGDTAQTLQERIDNLETAISELEGVACLFDDEDESEGEPDAEKEERMRKRCCEIGDELQSALNNVSV